MCTALRFMDSLLITEPRWRLAVVKLSFSTNRGATIAARWKRCQICGRCGTVCHHRDAEGTEKRSLGKSYAALPLYTLRLCGDGYNSTIPVLSPNLSC